jgi:hypothetical protein
MSNNDGEVITSLFAQKIHRNESAHRHHDIEKMTCSYCTNVARLAYSVINERSPFEGAAHGILSAVAAIAAETLREQAESLLEAAHQLDGEDR